MRASCCTELCGFKDPSPQRLTLHKQLGSDLPAAGPALASSSIRRPPLPPQFPSWALQTINRSRFEQEGSSEPAWAAGQTGAPGSWGKGCVVWQGQLSLRTLLLPQNANGGGWARFGTCRHLGEGPPTLCSLRGFSKAARPEASPATSHPDLSGCPCQGTSVLTRGNQPPARPCQDISVRPPRLLASSVFQKQASSCVLIPHP